MTKSEQLSVITHNILFANDLACGAVVQAVADARKSPLCRYRFRQRINAIEKERRDYEHRIQYVVESKADYYMEACDQFTEKVERGIRIFFISIKQTLDRNRTEHSMLIARLQWARAIVQLAVQIWNDRTEEIAALDLMPDFLKCRGITNVRRHLDYLNLGKLRTIMGQLLDEYFDESNYMECPDGQTMFNLIDRYMHDYQAVVRAAAHGSTQS